MKRLSLLMILIPSLAACGSENDANFQPGNYQLKNELVYLTTEGVPPALEAAFKAQLVGTGGKSEVCFKSSSAARPMKEIVHDVLGATDACTTLELTAKDGKMSGGIGCPAGGKDSGMRGISINGTYSSTAINLDLVGVEDVPQVKGGKLNTLTKMSFIRTGECK